MSSKSRNNSAVSKQREWDQSALSDNDASRNHAKMTNNDMPHSSFPTPHSPLPNLYSPLTIGSLELPGNLFLAPVAGYTDRAFRSICAEMGADFSFTELISSEALSRKPEHYGLVPEEAGRGYEESLTQRHRGHRGIENDVNASKSIKERVNPTAAALVNRGRNETRYAVQLFGADPQTMAKAAALLSPLKPDAVDINAGCPVPKVVKTGAGSALMKDPLRMSRIIEAMVKASEQYLEGAPVTIKIRSGWDSSSINYLECARIAVESGAAMISLHPRTRVQGYEGKSNWDHIGELAVRLSVPVTGSGDLYTPEDARRMLSQTKCAALMFARGAMGNPFIFGATKALLKGASWTEPDLVFRFKTALRHLEMLAEDLGEKQACLEMRKQFCAYTKGNASIPGIKGGAALRKKIVCAGTIAEYRQILS